jgi:hypothetical protein
MLIKKSYKTINSTENISEKYNKELGKLILHSGQSWGGGLSFQKNSLFKSFPLGSK